MSQVSQNKPNINSWAFLKQIHIKLFRKIVFDFSRESFDAIFEVIV